MRKTLFRPDHPVITSWGIFRTFSTLKIVLKVRALSPGQPQIQKKNKGFRLITSRLARLAFHKYRSHSNGWRWRESLTLAYNRRFQPLNTTAERSFGKFRTANLTKNKRLSCIIQHRRFPFNQNVAFELSATSSSEWNLLWNFHFRTSSIRHRF